MKPRSSFFLAVFTLISFFGLSQNTDTVSKKLDSLRNKVDARDQNNDIQPEAYNANTKIDFATYFTLLGSDFKQQFTAPFHTSKESWMKVGGFALLTGALSFGDAPIQKSALQLRNSSSTVRNISGHVTNMGGLYEGYTLAALGTYSLIFKNEKLKTTTLLATQAYITAGVIGTLAKYITGRQRPSYYGNDPIEAKATFHGPISAAGRSYNGQTISSSFPSGHTAVAFAAATVFAMEYKDKPFIPVLAYGAATMIGVSRITENKHWATDVLVGAALGFLSGRQVVNNYHRYADFKSGKPKTKNLTFNLQYSQGQFMPGLVYKF
jgi:hypothetical protein